MKSVRSEAIAAIDWTGGVLTIWFHKTGCYRYSGVPESVYIAFAAAESKGRFFQDRIVGRYPFSRC